MYIPMVNTNWYVANKFNYLRLRRLSLIRVKRLNCNNSVKGRSDIFHKSIKLSKCLIDSNNTFFQDSSEAVSSELQEEEKNSLLGYEAQIVILLILLMSVIQYAFGKLYYWHEKNQPIIWGNILILHRNTFISGIAMNSLYLSKLYLSLII